MSRKWTKWIRPVLPRRWIVSGIVDAAWPTKLPWQKVNAVGLALDQRDAARSNASTLRMIAADAEHRGKRRIVGMHRELDAGLLGDRHHPLEEHAAASAQSFSSVILQRLLALGRALGEPVIVARGQRAAAGARRDRGAEPVEEAPSSCSRARGCRAHPCCGSIWQTSSSSASPSGVPRLMLSIGTQPSITDEVEAEILVALLQPGERQVVPQRHVGPRRADRHRRIDPHLAGEVPHSRRRPASAHRRSAWCRRPPGPPRSGAFHWLASFIF